MSNVRPDEESHLVKCFDLLFGLREPALPSREKLLLVLNATQYAFERAIINRK